MSDKNLFADWTFPSPIIIGAGRIRELDNWLLNHKITSILIITDQTMASSIALKKILKRLDKSSLSFGVFSAHIGVSNNNALETAIKLYKSGSFNAIIGFGGGNVLDLAKLLALFSLQSADPINLILPNDSCPPPPIILVPTLAGSGSEINESAYLANSNNKIGQTFHDRRFQPSLVILDPELTMTASPLLIASAGMNALVNAVESWCSPLYNPVRDALSLETIRIIFEALPKAVETPSDIDAQTQLMSASIMGAMASNRASSTTATLANSVCYFYQSHYGLTAGILLPYVLAFHQTIIGEKIDILNKRLGYLDGFNGFARQLLKLRKSIALPSKLTSINKQLKIKIKDKTIIDSLILQDQAFDDASFKLSKSAAKSILSAANIGKMQRTK